MVSPLQTRALPRASELGLFLYAVYATFKVLLKAHNEAVKERKKQEAVTYYLHIVYSSISHIICIVCLSPLKTRALPRASELGQRKWQNHMCVSLNRHSIGLQSIAQGKEGRNSKKLILNIYLLSIALPLKHAPYQSFRARSEKSEKL